MKFILYLLIIPIIGLSQNTINHSKKAITKQQINQLHDGALLVRLITKKNAITTLRNMGNHKLADEKESEQITLNKTIIYAFRNHFNFCPVYFFYSDYTEAIKNNKLNDIIFLNDSLNLDPKIIFKESSFLTAEFTLIDNADFEALIIKDKQFVQLKRPFPFYVRTFDSLSNKKKLNQIIITMNDRLENFYKKRNK